MERYKKQRANYYFNAYFSIFEPTHFYHKPRIDKLFSFIPEKCSVLDAGCGSGILLYLLKNRKKCKIAGLDINEDCVKFTTKICKINSIETTDIRFFSLSKKFDVIVCSEVLEHFNSEDQKKIISNLDKHLKQGGMIILTYPTFLYHKIIEKIWAVIRRKIYPDIIFDDENFHSITNTIELFKEFKKRGYRMKTFEFYCFYLVNYLLLIKE